MTGSTPMFQSQNTTDALGPVGGLSPLPGPFEINAPQVDYVQLVLLPMLRRLFNIQVQMEAARLERFEGQNAATCYGLKPVSTRRYDRPN